MKNCKSCKKEIAKNAKVCPNCGAKLGMPFWLKFIIILIIIIVCIIGCTSSCVNSVDKAVTETKNAYIDINGKTSFKLNESFENSFEKITMTEVNNNFKDYSSYLGPKSGNKIIMAKFEVENINKENDELYVSSFEFNAYADGNSVEKYYYINNSYKDLSATVGINKKTIGYVFYEVPINAQKITIEYNANFWIDGNTIEFIVQ